MTDTSKLRFLKFEDLATKNEFEFARVQLCAAIKLHNAHKIQTKIKESSDRWEKVMKISYDEKDGLLRTFKPYANGRNFRLLMEKVFSKAVENVAVHKVAGSDILPGVLDLSLLGETFFKYKKEGEAKSQKRKEIMNQQKDDMRMVEESMGLVPNPTEFDTELIQTPKSNNNIDSGSSVEPEVVEVTTDTAVAKRQKISSNLTDFGKFGQIDLSKSESEPLISPRKIDFDQTSRKSVKKKPSTIKKSKSNRSMDLLNFLDSQTPELDNMFKEVSSTLKKMVPNKNEKSKVDQLKDLLSVKKMLKDEGHDTEVISEQINDLLQSMKK